MEVYVFQMYVFTPQAFRLFCVLPFVNIDGTGKIGDDRLSHVLVPQSYQWLVSLHVGSAVHMKLY